MKGTCRVVLRMTCALLALASAPVGAQHGDSALGRPSGPFIAISVASIDAVLPWYRDTLAFQVHRQGTAPGGSIRFALLQHGTALIELLQLPDARPRAVAAPGTTTPHQIHGFFKSGLIVEDIDAAFRQLTARGVPMAYALGQPPDGPYRSFGVRDPEGNLLQFFGR